MFIRRAPSLVADSSTITTPLSLPSPFIFSITTTTSGTSQPSDSLSTDLSQATTSIAHSTTSASNFTSLTSASTSTSTDIEQTITATTIAVTTNTATATTTTTTIMAQTSGTSFSSSSFLPSDSSSSATTTSVGFTSTASSVPSESNSSATSTSSFFAIQTSSSIRPRPISSSSSSSSSSISTTKAVKTSTSFTISQPSSTFTSSVDKNSVTSVPFLATVGGTSTTSDAPSSNPTRSVSDSTVNNSSFFNNLGQVVGTFVAAGVVVMILILGAICALRRCRHRKRRPDSIRWPPSDTGSSFSSLSKVPTMRPTTTHTYRSPSMGWSTQPRATGATVGPLEPLLTYPLNEISGVRLANTRASAPLYPLYRPEPYSELRVIPEYNAPNTGLAITTDQQTVRLSVVSIASSQSLYSDMRSAEDDVDSLYEREMGISPGGGNDRIKTQRTTQYQPLVPPTSWSKPASPISELPYFKSLEAAPAMRGRQAGLFTDVPPTAGWREVGWRD